MDLRLKAALDAFTTAHKEWGDLMADPVLVQAHGGSYSDPIQGKFRKTATTFVLSWARLSEVLSLLGLTEAHAALDSYGEVAFVQAEPTKCERWARFARLMEAASTS